MAGAQRVVVSISGRDFPGVIAEISGMLAEKNVNIVDMAHTTMEGMFAMLMVLDLAEADIGYGELRQRLDCIAGRFELHMEFGEVCAEPWSGPAECPGRGRHVLSVIAADRPGMVHEVSKCLLENGIRIMKTGLVARGRLITIEIVADVGEKDENRVRAVLLEEFAKSRLDVVFQREDVFRSEKKLIVFDMDSTVVDAEITDEIAKKAGLEPEVRALTQRAMDGEIGFDESLRERLRLLRGVDESVLKEVYDELRLTPGAGELIRTLREHGYKIALVSGGFTYFADRLGEALDFDHVFANRLVIEDNKLTGEIEGDVVNAEKKGEIIRELMRMYGLRKEQVVAVGDGANDRVMLESAGLGIAFNAKEALRKVSSGILSRENFIGILDVL